MELIEVLSSNGRGLKFTRTLQGKNFQVKRKEFEYDLDSDTVLFEGNPTVGEFTNSGKEKLYHYWAAMEISSNQEDTKAQILAEQLKIILNLSECDVKL